MSGNEFGKGFLTILVAEDEEEIRNGFRDALERQGYKVMVTDNGYSAITILSDWGDTIDAVVLDMSMPIMDGDWVLRSYAHLGIRIPVVVVSGLPEDEVTKKTHGANVFCRLKKPCKVSDVVAAVDAATGRAVGRLSCTETEIAGAA